MLQQQSDTHSSGNCKSLKGQSGLAQANIWATVDQEKALLVICLIWQTFSLAVLIYAIFRSFCAARQRESHKWNAKPHVFTRLKALLQQSFPIAKKFYRGSKPPAKGFGFDPFSFFDFGVSSSYTLKLRCRQQRPHPRRSARGHSISNSWHSSSSSSRRQVLVTVELLLHIAVHSVSVCHHL